MQLPPHPFWSPTDWQRPNIKISTVFKKAIVRARTHTRPPTHTPTVARRRTIAFVSWHKVVWLTSHVLWSFAPVGWQLVWCGFSTCSFNHTEISVLHKLQKKLQTHEEVSSICTALLHGRPVWLKESLWYVETANNAWEQRMHPFWLCKTLAQGTAGAMFLVVCMCGIK